MKKLVVASAAVLAATLFSGNAFAIPGAQVKAVEAPSAAINVNCGCGGCAVHAVRHRCVSYYTTYTYTYSVPTCGGCGCGCGGWGGGFFGLFGW